MTVWIDAQLPPAIAGWIEQTFSVSAIAIRDLGLRDAEDQEIFRAAQKVGVIVLTKDIDFVSLSDRFGAPPQIIWLTCGNTSNSRLKEILSFALGDALVLLSSGERVVEISST
jgi:predicted nuclease of predicted toxin-antitoxin system